jgi:hypothetical protein
MGNWELNPHCWPDPQAMVDELRSMDIELMVTFWPYVLYVSFAAAVAATVTATTDGFCCCYVYIAVLLKCDGRYDCMLTICCTTTINFLLALPLFLQIPRHEGGRPREQALGGVQ